MPASTATRRPVVVVLLAAAVAVAVVWLLVADGDDGGRIVTRSENARPGDIGPRELHDASFTVVGEELWVFGGVSGPDGSSPPTTSWLPEGWGSNDVVTVYRPDGSIRRQLRVPALADRMAIGGRVVARGGDRYLITSTCPGSTWCTGIRPTLIRIDDAGAAEVSFVRPDRRAGDALDVGFLLVVGQSADGTVWVTERVPADTDLPVQPVRLLALDLDTGAAAELPFPDGLFQQGTTCMTSTTLYTVQVELGASRASALRVLHRPPTTEPAAWEVLSEPIDNPASVTGGTLSCLADGTIGLQVHSYPDSFLHTLSGETGAPVAEPVTTSARVVGDLDGTDIAVSVDVRDGQQRVLTRTAGGSWQSTETVLDREARLVVFGGELRDIRALLTSTDPDGQAMTTIDVVTEHG